jgi:hypothetical protein
VFGGGAAMWKGPEDVPVALEALGRDDAPLAARLLINHGLEFGPEPLVVLAVEDEQGQVAEERDAAVDVPAEGALVRLQPHRPPLGLVNPGKPVRVRPVLAHDLRAGHGRTVRPDRVS